MILDIRSSANSRDLSTKVFNSVLRRAKVGLVRGSYYWRLLIETDLLHSFGLEQLLPNTCLPTVSSASIPIPTITPFFFRLPAISQVEFSAKKHSPGCCGDIAVSIEVNYHGFLAT
jgi:hypothetical protein